MIYFEENKEKEEIIEEKNEEVKPESKKDKKQKENKKIKKLEEKILELETNNQYLKQEYLKAYAELENFRKRKQKEIEDINKYSSQKLIEELLLSLDQLKIVSNYPVDNPQLQNYLYGFKMISDKVFETLELNGLKAYETKLGDDFDSNIHHAVEVEYNNDKKDNEVIKVIQQGYYYKDRLLRPAMVIVNKIKEENKEINIEKEEIIKEEK